MRGRPRHGAAAGITVLPRRHWRRADAAMPITVSPNNYRGATRIALVIISAIYFVAGCLISFSMRHLPGTGLRGAMQILVAIILCNGVIWVFQRIQLPAAERRLAQAVALKDKEGFARQIIRREMAKAIQPAGGIAMTIGLLLMVLLLRLMGWVAP
jgi:hypothetical protein